ncbi:MAG TPA: beta-ketoacyl-[acyl-carrier-protein] synthase II, partial [Sporomusaceae bacterium]|nr:beta-ketoacyl-[acyl-carrier-protein] synthase II [Sporomusaceae bacterium]
MKKRVVITGLGAITPIGTGKDEFWNALLDGKSGISRITRFDPSDFATQIAGEIKDFDPGKFMDKKEAKRM